VRLDGILGNRRGYFARGDGLGRALVEEPNWDGEKVHDAVEKNGANWKVIQNGSRLEEG